MAHQLTTAISALPAVPSWHNVPEEKFPVLTVEYGTRVICRNDFGFPGRLLSDREVAQEIEFHFLQSLTVTSRKIREAHLDALYHWQREIADRAADRLEFPEPEEFE